jgi:uncharacterized protein (TIGR00661 family)
MKIYKKKILVGICGLGNGHNVRQTNIITKLLKKGHQIVLFVTTDNEKQISTTFPSLKKIIVKIPWVFCGKNGVDFRKTKDKYLVDGFDWYRESLSAFIKVDEEFKGKPDLVMTDYEPNSAQYSYARNIPLICLEQQSKFIGHPFEDIDKFAREAGDFFAKFDSKDIVLVCKREAGWPAVEKFSEVTGIRCFMKNLKMHLQYLSD